MKLNETKLRGLIRKLVIEMMTVETELAAQKPAVTKPKAGLTKANLGGQTAVRKSEDFIDALKDLDDMRKTKAIAYVLSKVGMDVKTFQSNIARIRTNLRKYEQ
jgi:hypothetical protein